MKNYNDIISRFDDIPDLPVSEEMLGAYLEDNLSAEEYAMVDNLISDNATMQSYISEIQDIAIDNDGDVLDLVELPDILIDDLYLFSSTESDNLFVNDTFVNDDPFVQVGGTDNFSQFGDLNSTTDTQYTTDNDTFFDNPMSF